MMGKEWFTQQLVSVVQQWRINVTCHVAVLTPQSELSLQEHIFHEYCSIVNEVIFTINLKGQILRLKICILREKTYKNSNIYT